jgi:uracil-DNA glycosylase family protein
MHTAASESAAPFVPDHRTLPVLREAIQHCRGCTLYRNATQAVFGELETGAEAKRPKVAVMMIGEQPGNQEDLEGRPFVGPAGKLLDRCLEEAKIDRRKVYVTNTVKHFKWEPHGKLRIHKKPSMKEIHACRPWLEAELEAVRPELIVCLGAVAAQSCWVPSSKLRNHMVKSSISKDCRRLSQLCIHPRFCVLGRRRTASGTPEHLFRTWGRSARC